MITYSWIISLTRDWISHQLIHLINRRWTSDLWICTISWFLTSAIWGFLFHPFLLLSSSAMFDQPRTLDFFAWDYCYFQVSHVTTLNYWWDLVLSTILLGLMAAASDFLCVYLFSTFYLNQLIFVSASHQTGLDTRSNDP